ncbi:hypothetical protein DRF65_03335 [Chryseobacterium pennae]|uniref:Uncharacterized protein n=1 Tax=Chryseobacterium pennae TaxID=2258962 RepID=A0A3D9CDE8_9FLAO|nr:hypothetical protein [Chryseobacterium pennae]REC63754.1 hypothetical protein DRF65_03335 [Chryseobacterium pennae]
MKKIFLIILTSVSAEVWGQVGINISNPSAALDIISKGNDLTTKALEINNSDGSELFKLQNNGYLGINTGISLPTDLLHIKTEVKHENLPVLSSPYSPLAVDASGAAKVKPATIQYFYFKRSSSFGNFSLYNTNMYTNIPFPAGGDVKGNTTGFGFGTDVSGTVNSQSVSNISYLTIPEPGVYLFEMYQTAFCTGLPTTSSNTGQIAINTIFATAGNGSSAYSTNTIFRDYAIARRNATGGIHTSSYAYANPQKLIVAYQSTAVNEKVALFVNYAGGDSYNTQTCQMNIPNGSDNYGYLIVTKL